MNKGFVFQCHRFQIFQNPRSPKTVLCHPDGVKIVKPLLVLDDSRDFYFFIFMGKLSNWNILPAEDNYCRLVLLTCEVSTGKQNNALLWPVWVVYLVWSAVLNWEWIWTVASKTLGTAIQNEKAKQFEIKFVKYHVMTYFLFPVSIMLIIQDWN